MGVIMQNDEVIFRLGERVDAANADAVQERIEHRLRETGAQRLVLDASEMSYISSAGLRAIIRMVKRGVSVCVDNVSSEVYEVFELTGFTQLMEVRKRLRSISLDGLKQIGAGANGWVYRLNNEQVLKVYNPLTNPPQKIAQEKEVARKALILGIPSAISFDMVAVSDSYGIVYELVDALTLGETVAKSPKRADEYAKRMAQMLKQLHATEFEEGELPDARLGLHAWVDVSEKSGYYAPEIIAKVRALVDSIPKQNTFVHGDFHPANIMVTDDDELLLIDMGDASAGDPIIDLLGSYQLMCLVASRPGAAELYTGMSNELLAHVWHVFVREYYGTCDDQAIERIEQRLKFYAIIRSMAGITFSSVLTDDERRKTADDITAAFQRGWEAMRVVE